MSENNSSKDSNHYNDTIAVILVLVFIQILMSLLLAAAIDQVLNRLTVIEQKIGVVHGTR